jgi:hypothetical protein
MVTGTVEIRRAAGDVAPATHIDGTLVDEITAQDDMFAGFFNDTQSLQPGVKYSYSWFYQDSSGAWSTPVSASAVAPSPPAELDWSAGTVVDPMVGVDLAMSCATTSFCMASNGHAYQTFDGSQWSEPKEFPLGILQFGEFNNVSGGEDGGLLSCTGPTFCMAADLRSWSTWDGSAWSEVERFGAVFPPTVSGSAHVTGLSCVSPTFCVAMTDDTESAVWNGTSWTHYPAYAEATFQSTNVWCRATTSCLAVPALGNDGTWNGSGWTTADASGLVTVDCATTCVGFRKDGTPEFAATLTGVWHTGTSPWPAGTYVYGIQVGCGLTACWAVAASEDGVLTSTYDGLTWSTPTMLFPDADRPKLACDQSRCLALAHSRVAPVEQQAIESGGTWSSPTVMSHDNVEIGTACRRGGGCLLADQLGNVRTATGSGWSAPEKADANGNVAGISCGSTVCAEIDADGGAVVEAGSGWTAREAVDAVALVAISCAPDDSCMAVDTAGSTVAYHDGGWGAVTPGPPSSDTSPDWAVACGSATHCVVNDGSTAWVGPGTWTAVGPNGTTAYGNGAMACATATTCVVSGYTWLSAVAAWLDGDTWGSRTLGLESRLPQDSPTVTMTCPGTDFCVAGSFASGTIVTFSRTGTTSVRVPANTDYLASIDCSGPAHCIAVDKYGVVTMGAQ